MLQSVLVDSPRSYVGPMWKAMTDLGQRRTEKALEGFHMATHITDRSPDLLLLGADAAFTLGRASQADSILRRIDALCDHCPFYYQYEARIALARGDTAVADSILAHAPLPRTRGSSRDSASGR